MYGAAEAGDAESDNSEDSARSLEDIVAEWRNAVVRDERRSVEWDAEVGQLRRVWRGARGNGARWEPAVLCFGRARERSTTTIGLGTQWPGRLCRLQLDRTRVIEIAPLTLKHGVVDEDVEQATGNTMPAELSGQRLGR